MSTLNASPFLGKCLQRAGKPRGSFHCVRPWQGECHGARQDRTGGVSDAIDVTNDLPPMCRVAWVDASKASRSRGPHTWMENIIKIALNEAEQVISNVITSVRLPLVRARYVRSDHWLTRRENQPVTRAAHAALSPFVIMPFKELCFLPFWHFHRGKVLTLSESCRAFVLPSILYRRKV